MADHTLDEAYAKWEREQMLIETNCRRNLAKARVNLFAGNLLSKLFTLRGLAHASAWSRTIFTAFRD